MSDDQKEEIKNDKKVTQKECSKGKKGEKIKKRGKMKIDKKCHLK